MTITMIPHLGRVLEQVTGRSYRFRELEERAARLEHYQAMQHTITQIIARSLDLDQAILRIIRTICEATDWDFGEVWHVDSPTNALCCALRWHVPSLHFRAFSESSQAISFPRGKGLPGRVWASARPAWITNVVNDPNFLRAPLAERDGLHGGLGIPIRTDGEIIGVLALFSRQTRQPDRELLRVLDTIGSQIGLFIERKRIEQAERDQARTLAAVEERQRLARDLHDSVTQTLFSASVIAEMLPVLWTRSPEQVLPGLTELQQLTRGALTEMRSLLVELRPTALLRVTLAELLKNLADDLRDRTQINVSLDVNGAYLLPSDVQLTLYRIAQEALNNIVKHAAPNHVRVQLCGNAVQLEMHIQDDGQGFEIANMPTTHFGLGIMRERAEEIGASFHLQSALGCGTHLTVIVPLARPQPVKTLM